MPIIGILNFTFAWLRKPFESDLALKEGVAHSALPTRDVHSGSSSPDLTEQRSSTSEDNCVVRCSRATAVYCVDSVAAKKCVQVTFPCLSRTARKVVPEEVTSKVTCTPAPPVSSQAIETGSAHRKSWRDCT